MTDPIPELLELMGGNVVFIDWPKGVKGTKKKWKHLTIDHMTKSYLDKLKYGNIGVALGEKSGGLCAIDIDRDDLVQPFLDLNPHLASTLQTYGARGRNFWVRFKGNYPRKTTTFKTHSGKEVGEFRSNGVQSIISGIHPDTKEPYEFVVRQQVVEIEFTSIQWPREISNLPGCTEDTQDTEEYRRDPSHCVSSVPSVSSGSSVHHDWFFSIKTLDDALRHSLPSRVHQNNHRLFDYARGVKAVEAQEGKFTPQQLRNAFDRWYAAAIDYLRKDQTKEEYSIEFFNAYQSAKYPLGGKAILAAWALANEEPIPPEATQFENPKLRSLVALCRQLQILAGKEPFYLASRTCQRLFQHESHTTAAKWLKCLCALQIIVEVERGTNRRASRYRYLLPLNSAEGT